MTAIGNISRAIFITFFFGSVFAVAGYGMGQVLKLEDAPAAEAAQEEVVRYRELKNLGGGTYLCEVWTRSYLDTTLMKLTATEKAKLQRAY